MNNTNVILELVLPAGCVVKMSQNSILVAGEDVFVDRPGVDPLDSKGGIANSEINFWQDGSDGVSQK